MLEVCVDSYASCVAAVAGGADRLELCANLIIGGTTPSNALFCQVRERFTGAIHVLIRPRFGDFLYTEEEQWEMCESIRRFRELGADGIVIGALRPEGVLDQEKMRELVECAGAMSVTLHRAFDMTRDPRTALEEAIVLGCRTILTSGQRAAAIQGVPLLAELYRAADGRIDIMAGAGVNSQNISQIHDLTGITTFHTSGRRGTLDSGMIYRKAEVSMGLPSISEYEILRTDEAEVRACSDLLTALTFTRFQSSGRMSQ
ncbi:MAG: copper homeostasis protein CutC [Eubacteriales bacterium]|nr:copper homeostasis protein CutC [Eubacteriales bacterium]